jgi:hypothetical protein
VINEELTQRELNVAVRVGNITVAELRKALEKIIVKITQSKNSKSQVQSKSSSEQDLKSGKQTLKQLHKHNEGLTSIELKDPNLRMLFKEMKRNDIDFSVLKDGKGKYTLFFKGKNADEMTHAFKQYTEKMVAKVERKPIKEVLKEAKVAARALLDKGLDKVKNRSKGAIDR